MSKRCRNTVFARDGHRCLKCGTTENLTLDHIVPKAMGGTNKIVNKQTLCVTCNIEKGATIELLCKTRKSKNYVNNFKYGGEWK